VGDTVVAAVRAGPFLAGPHSEVWPVLNVWAKSVKYGFSRLNVSLIVEADGLLCFSVTVNGGFCDVGTVLVSLRNHAESLSQCVKRITFESQLAAGDSECVDGLPWRGWSPTVFEES